LGIPLQTAQSMPAQGFDPHSNPVASASGLPAKSDRVRLVVGEGVARDSSPSGIGLDGSIANSNATAAVGRMTPRIVLATRTDQDECTPMSAIESEGSRPRTIEEELHSRMLADHSNGDLHISDMPVMWHLACKMRVRSLLFRAFGRPPAPSETT